MLLLAYESSINYLNINLYFYYYFKVFALNIFISTEKYSNFELYFKVNAYPSILNLSKPTSL